jgi:two-component system response regulator FixJ
VGKAGNEAPTSEAAKQIFEHTDRYGRVSLLPLRTEAQKLFVVASQPHAGGAQDTAQEAARSLTAREWQVFDLLIAGPSNKLIAFELQISPRTVEIHRAHLMRKMGVRTTAAPVRAALAARGQAALCSR